MTGGARPEPRVLTELIGILASSLREASTVETIATLVNAKGKVKLDGNALTQWTVLIDYAADRPTMWKELLSTIDFHMKEMYDHEKFVAWREQNDQNSGSSQNDDARIGQAVSEVQKLRSSLLALSDPRQGMVYLQTMRSSIIVIKEIIETMPGRSLSAPLILTGAAEEAAAARSEILFACKEALREVDQLTIDIFAAGRQSDRLRLEYSGQEAFTAESSMVRHLLNDRGLVDLASHVLLEVIGQQLSHLGLPVREDDFRGQGVPAQPAES